MIIDFPSEKAIEDYLEGVISETGNCPLNGSRVDLLLRQKEIPGYGRADLIKICVDPGVISVTITELKNEPLQEVHLSQLCRYMSGVDRIGDRYRRFLRGWDVEVFGELAGPLFTEQNDLVFMLDQLECVELYALELSMGEGFKSNSVPCGWFKCDEKPKSGRPVAKQILPVMTSVERQLSKIRHLREVRNG